MATPAVQAASCAGAATAVITTTVIVVPNADAIPEHHLYTSTDKVTESDKFGADLYPFLINHKDSKNQKWWEWSFRQLTRHKEEKTLNDVFKDLTSAWDGTEGDGDTNSKSLNKFCHHQIKTTATSSTDAVTKSIWKYCSPLGTKPVTVSEANETSKYGANLGNTKSTELISLSGNFLFWNLKNSWFKNENFSDAFFKPFKDNSEKTLKDACEKAYDLAGDASNASADKPKQDSVPKFCGLKIQTVT